MTRERDQTFVEPWPIFDLATMERHVPECWPDDPDLIEGYEDWLRERGELEAV